MTKLRTFVALEVPDAVKREAGHVQERLCATGAALRAVSKENMHLTLRFIGDWEESALGDLCDVVDRAAARVAPFDLIFKGVGAFPKVARPKVVFLDSLSEPAYAVGELHRVLQEELEDLGIRPEGRRFRPHLTLARVRGTPVGTGLSETICRFSDFDGGVAPVSEVVVVLSELTREGPIYTIAGRAGLGEPDPGRGEHAPL